MRLGLIARADNRGLGQQTWAVYRNLHPVKTMVVDCPSAHPLPMRYERFPDATIVRGWPTPNDFHTWLQGLDVVYTAETGYGAALWDMAEGLGVRTVLHANFEFLNPADRPSVWAAPSLWRFGEFPGGAVFLPVPIETDRLPATPAVTSHFLHLVGRPAHMDRNGTRDLLQALQYVESTITVTIKCQQPGYVSGLIAQHDVRPPSNVTLVVDNRDVENYWDLYTGGTLVMPRRFGGLCLPVNEALGARMPVIATNISPNNTWLPSEWLVEANRLSEFRAKQRIEVYGVHPPLLAAKIDAFAEPGFYARARYEAETLAKGLSWDALRSEYEQILQGS